MFRKVTQFRFGNWGGKGARLCVLMFLVWYLTYGTAHGVGPQSVDGTYNIVLFGSDHGSEFTSGIGHIEFDGAGNWSGEVNEVSHGQSPGSAFEAGPVSGTYTVAPNGKLTLSDLDNGYVSGDGSLIAWAPVPGDVPYEETGINIGIQKGSGMGLESLNGRYNIVLFGSDHGSQFTSGIGYVDFDGSGNWSGEVNEVSQGQSTPGAFDVGPVSGTYSVDPNGKINLSNLDSGCVSADGSVIVWAPVPGDTQAEETGINVAIRQASGMGAGSLYGRYNIVLFDSDHGSEFTSGVGYIDLDSDGNWSGEVSDVSQGQSTGSAFEAGPISGTYEVAPNGALTLSELDNGYVSADGSLIVFAPVPGDIPYEETGINIGIKISTMPVQIDVKPRSCPNPFNVKAQGVLPAAILGSEGFDVNTIDIDSVKLEGVSAIRGSLEDVATPIADGNDCECTTAGPDGFVDLALKFDAQEILAALGQVADGEVVPLTLTGLLRGEFGGTAIEGADCVVVRARGREE